MADTQVELDKKNVLKRPGIRSAGMLVRIKRSALHLLAGFFVGLTVYILPHVDNWIGHFIGTFADYLVNFTNYVAQKAGNISLIPILHIAIVCTVCGLIIFFRGRRKSISVWETLLNFLFFTIGFSVMAFFFWMVIFPDAVRHWRLWGP